MSMQVRVLVVMIWSLLHQSLVKVTTGRLPFYIDHLSVLFTASHCGVERDRAGG